MERVVTRLLAPGRVATGILKHDDGTEFRVILLDMGLIRKAADGKAAKRKRTKH